MAKKPVASDLTRPMQQWINEPKQFNRPYRVTCRSGLTRTLHALPCLNMRIIASFLTLLSFLGCKPNPSVPKQAGVSTALTYPVLLIGQSSLDVRDSEDALISVPGASSLNLVERLLLDSQGRLFKVTRAAVVEGSSSIMLDMGTSRRRYFVEVAEQNRPSWPQIEELVLDQVRSRSSVWAGDGRAVARVRALRDVGELIDASRESWNWTR